MTQSKHTLAEKKGRPKSNSFSLLLENQDLTHEFARFILVLLFCSRAGKTPVDWAGMPAKPTKP
jgi:hypothetical protein